MSMREYAVNDYGLLMSEKMLKMVCMKACKNFTEEEYDYDEWAFYDELYERGIVEYISEFTGEALAVTDKGEDDWSNNDNSSDSDIIYYVPCRNISTLFKAAYNDMDEIIAEFKEKLGEYFQDDFDYRYYIRHIVGTYYG